tara:strand:+ start:72 stop:1544 length:1473 start_codon:yes stop_codon:yes gene_type:complete
MRYLAYSMTVVALWTNPEVRADQPVSKDPRVQSNMALLEAWIESQMAYKGIPGMCVAIVHDQEVIFQRGFGYADLETKKPTTPDTLYRIASHSKLFTAISIMRLRDEGHLQLDDPVKKHLPWFQLKGLDKNAPTVTIRHLMTHSSGIPREGGDQLLWTNFQFPTTETIMRHIKNQSAVFPAETRWKYSNLAFALLGEIVAAVADMPFDKYVERHIMKPLKMSASGVSLSSIDRKKLATGYGRRLPAGTRQALPVIDARGMAAAAGVTASVSDMTRFVSWQFRLLNGDKTEVLRPSTLRSMQRIHWLDPKWNHGFGLTFIVYKQEDRMLVGHSGGFPGFLTATFISPEEQLAVIVFSNSLDAQPYPGQPLSIVDRAFDWVGGAIAKAQAGPSSTAKHRKDRYKHLKGTYRCIWGDSQVMELDGQFVVINITHPHPKKTISVLQPMDESRLRFRVTRGDPFVPLGERVSFLTDKDGNAHSMVLGRTKWSRVE